MDRNLIDKSLMDMVIFIEKNKIPDGLYICWYSSCGWCYILSNTYEKHPKKYNKLYNQMCKLSKDVLTCFIQIEEGKVII